MSKTNIVFVCYKTSPQTGLSVVDNVVEDYALARDFKLQSVEDKISRYVEAFIVQGIGRDFMAILPVEVLAQLKVLEEL